MKLLFYFCITALVFCQCKAFWFDFYDYDSDEVTTKSSGNIFEVLFDTISELFQDTEPEDDNTEETTENGSVSNTTESVERIKTDNFTKQNSEKITEAPLFGSSTTEKLEVKTTVEEEKVSSPTPSSKTKAKKSVRATN